MTTHSHDALSQTQETVTQLVEVCRKGGPLYRKQPQAVAQVNRTAKWLLYAIRRLNSLLQLVDNQPVK